MRYAAIFMLLLVAACAAKPPEPVIKTVTVEVPVAAACLRDIGPEPIYADNDAALKAAPDLFTRVKLLLAGRLQRIDRDTKRMAADLGCPIIPNSAPLLGANGGP